MIDARRATVDDAAELVRLRGLMLASMAGTEPPPGPWQDAARETLRERLCDPDEPMAAFVVDAPEAPGTLAACAVGTIERRLGGPANPSGRVGYVFNVCTDPRHRRRGYSRACMTALLDWYRRREVRTVDLRTSEPGQPLYRSLGFHLTRDPAMRLALPADPLD
ncbi:GNAT family N-acetyltransferase [Micromonospora inositola]|uniref:Ribosomal protein S18 acetylase RimI n=1 Tax=Micromonospora inositola TaxID=47865 RepID=A0A1C5IXF3_9ACTN|nr:GNAT family N-acetyltransferase [Micromonospora inositola]SCG62965.1 Ribosomal protein S18 acetylase RimI [Micromonospora inositola]